MSIYNRFVKKISFPVLLKRFGYSGLLRELDFLETTQFWSRDKIEALQLERLRALVVHAYHTTKYYKKLFDEIAFNPAKLKSFDDIKVIPVLTKNIIRENLSSLLSTAYSKNQIHFSETGGTTGVKMKFYRNNACLSPKEAARYRFEKWTGWDIGERMGLVWTAQQDYVGHWTIKEKIKNALFERQIALPAAILNKEELQSYIRELFDKKPTMIRAFTSPLYEVARLLLDNNYRVSSVRGIVTTGEPLHSHQRELIERAFACKVFDSYRSREAGPLAQECSEHKGMHINAESLYLEIVEPAEKENFDAGIGEIIITDLLNYGMPFIRYEMGDMGAVSTRKCPCGRGLPLLEQISGRSADMLFTPDGIQITAGSLVLYLVDEAPGLIGQTQIIQDKIDHLLIKITADPAPSEELKAYQQRTVQRLFGPDMKVSFEIVDTIPRSKSGKYQFTKCLLKDHR